LTARDLLRYATTSGTALANASVGSARYTPESRFVDMPNAMARSAETRIARSRLTRGATFQ
jgi:hypothetical protein